MNINSGKNFVKIDLYGCEFKIEQFKGYMKGGTLAESEHARALDNSYEDDFGEIVHDIYALCEEGFEVEGEKLLMKALIEHKEKEIQSTKEELEDLQETLKKFKAKAESIDDSRQVEYGVYCTVELSLTRDANGNVRNWRVFERQASRENHGKDIVIDTIDGGMTNVHYEIPISPPNFIGYCWKEVLEQCKKMILEKEIEWMKEKRKERVAEYAQRIGDVDANILKAEALLNEIK